MSATLHPFPAPGTVDSLAIDILGGAAAEHVDAVDERLGDQDEPSYQAAWRFLSWLEDCEVQYGSSP